MMSYCLRDINWWYIVVSDNDIKYVVEPYTRQQMMDINTEFVEVTAYEHSDLEMPRSFWRIDYLTGIAIYWSDKYDDVQDLIRYAGTTENYLAQRGCENITQEDEMRNRFSFRPAAALADT
jgi:hypothetical protein